MDNKKLLGRRIKEAVVFRFAHTGYAIKQKNISQEKLAEMVGIEPTALSNIVTGRNYPLMKMLKNPKIDKFWRFFSSELRCVKVRLYAG